MFINYLHKGQTVDGEYYVKGNQCNQVKTAWKTDEGSPVSPGQCFIILDLMGVNGCQKFRSEMCICTVCIIIIVCMHDHVRSVVLC